MTKEQAVRQGVGAKPLKADRILVLWENTLRNQGMVKTVIVEFARAIEAEHGIRK